MELHEPSTCALGGVVDSVQRTFADDPPIGATLDVLVVDQNHVYDFEARPTVAVREGLSECECESLAAGIIEVPLDRDQW
jgi:hypothetical protein